MWEHVKAKCRWLGDHKTKIIGAAGIGAGYAENHLAQLGHLIPDHYRGALVAGLGAIVFMVGLINSMNP